MLRRSYKICDYNFNFRYYRFNSARKLTQLLLFDKDGCSSHHPGIGDVQLIKDLRNKKIVSTQFQCSRFGAHFHKSLGWVSIQVMAYRIYYYNW
jgi:hypothetical protein